MSDLTTYTLQQLLNRLVAAMSLFNDEQVSKADRHLAGQEVVNTLSEIRARGFKVSKSRRVFHLYPADKIEMQRPHGGVEMLSVDTCRSHVYFHIHDQMVKASRRGEHWWLGCSQALNLLVSRWHVSGIHEQERRLEF